MNGTGRKKSGAIIFPEKHSEGSCCFTICLTRIGHMVIRNYFRQFGEIVNSFGGFSPLPIPVKERRIKPREENGVYNSRISFISPSFPLRWKKYRCRRPATPLYPMKWFPPKSQERSVNCVAPIKLIGKFTVSLNARKGYLPKLSSSSSPLSSSPTPKAGGAGANEERERRKKAIMRDLDRH